MIWFIAVAVGFLMGLVYCAGLWVSVRHVLRPGAAKVSMPVGRGLRLAFALLVLAWLLRLTGVHALGALLGFWLARQFMIWRLGGPGRAR